MPGYHDMEPAQIHGQNCLQKDTYLKNPIYWTFSTILSIITTPLSRYSLGRINLFGSRKLIYLFMRRMQNNQNQYLCVH